MGAVPGKVGAEPVPGNVGNALLSGTRADDEALSTTAEEVSTARALLLGDP